MNIEIRLFLGFITNKNQQYHILHNKSIPCTKWSALNASLHSDGLRHFADSSSQSRKFRFRDPAFGGSGGPGFRGRRRFGMDPHLRGGKIFLYSCPHEGGDPSLRLCESFCTQKDVAIHPFRFRIQK